MRCIYRASNNQGRVNTASTPTGVFAPFDRDFFLLLWLYINKRDCLFRQIFVK